MLWRTAMSDVIDPITAQQEKTDAQETAQEGYLRRVLIALDQFANTALFDGHPDETISSHAARAAATGEQWGIDLSAFLHKFEKDHGVHAEAGDVERARIVTALEDGAGDLPTH